LCVLTLIGALTGADAHAEFLMTDASYRVNSEGKMYCHADIDVDEKIMGLPVKADDTYEITFGESRLTAGGEYQEVEVFFSANGTGNEFILEASEGAQFTDGQNPSVGFLDPDQDVSPHEGVEWPEAFRQQVRADTNKGRQLVGDAMAILSLSGLTHDRHIGMPAIAKQVQDAVRYYFNPPDFNPPNPTNWIEDLSKIYAQLEIIYVGLMNVDYRYVGEAGLCDPNKKANSLRAAYVYTKWEGVYYHGVSGNPIVHLCHKFFELGGDDERQDTLIHEISHHKPEPTVDFAYGRDVGRLALTGPESAIKNADTYALFVRKLTEIAALCVGDVHGDDS